MRNLMAALAVLMMTIGPALAGGPTNVNENNNTIHAKTTSRASATLTSTIVANISNGGGDIASIGFSMASLSGLPDGGGCVLAKTKSIQAGISIAGFGGQGGYADGETNPYYECNAKQTLAIYSAMRPGSIVCRYTHPDRDCHLASEIAARIASHLTGVDEAFDELDGNTPANGTPQTSQVTNGSPAPVQVADASASDASACNEALPTVQLMACKAKK